MSFFFFNHSCFRPRPHPQGVFPCLWRWGGKIQGKAPRFISVLIIEFNVQIFTVECTDIYKNTKKTLTGSVIPFLFNSLLTDTLQEGHLVLVTWSWLNSKKCIPTKFTPLAIQQDVIEAWWKVSSLLISGSGNWPQREAPALSLFFLPQKTQKIYRSRFAPALVKKFELDLQAGLGGKRRDRSHEWKKF